MTPCVSVVIPNWNGATLLERCLESLRRQRLDGFETILVDNGSVDDSVALARRRYPEVRVLELGVNGGFARAANAGADAARAPLLAFLNNDVECAPDWLEQLVDCCRRRPRAAAVTPKILRLHDPSAIDSAGDGMSWSLKAFRRGAGERDGGYEVEEQVFAAPGTACLWRGDAFHALGGFDEGFFAYYEDVDLSFRARLAGWEIWYAPLAVAHHAGGASSAAAAHVFDSYHSVRNRWAMIVKDAPAAWLVRRAHVILLGEALSLARAAAAGRLRLQLRAYGQVLASARSWGSERKRVQAQSAVDALSLMALVEGSFPPLRTSLAPRRPPPSKPERPRRSTS